MQKLDLRRELKHLYQPSAKAPLIVDVPPMRFLTISGVGGVGETSFQEALQAIFNLGYPVKFGAKKTLEIDYPVMPLEGLYWNADGGFHFDASRPERMAWKLLMMVPDVIPDEFIETMRADVAEKKNPPRLADVRIETLAEGPSVQIMYVGPYADETPTIERLVAYAAEQGYEVAGAHHEIYIGDPNRSAPEKLKTVLRYPVRQAG